MSSLYISNELGSKGVDVNTLQKHGVLELESYANGCRNSSNE